MTIRSVTIEKYIRFRLNKCFTFLISANAFERCGYASCGRHTNIQRQISRLQSRYVFKYESHTSYLDRESRLRTLRKQVSSMEDEESHLKKHIEQLQTNIGEVQHDIDTSTLQLNAITLQLNHWRNTLVNCLAHLPLPGFVFFLSI